MRTEFTPTDSDHLSEPADEPASGRSPGPWRYVPESSDGGDNYCGEIWAADGSVVTVFDIDPGSADARLIAAAPELMAALEDVWRHHLDDPHNWLPQVRAAINKVVHVDDAHTLKEARP